MQIELSAGQGDAHLPGLGVLGVAETNAVLIRFAGECFGIGKVGAQLILKYAGVIVLVALLIAVGLDVDRTAETAGRMRLGILRMRPLQTKRFGRHLVGLVILRDAVVKVQVEIAAVLYR